MNSIKIETVELKEMTPLELAKQLLAFWDLSGRPDDGQMYADMESVANALILQNEGVAPNRVKDGRAAARWVCGSCNCTVPSHFLSRFCGCCGTRLKWPSLD